MENTLSYEDLKGAIVWSVTGLEQDSTEVKIVTDKGTFVWYHAKSCCESVRVKEVVGTILPYSEILWAEERTNVDHMPPSYNRYDSFTWTFYNIRTTVGDCSIRWLGESSECCSETAELTRVKIMKWSK